MNDLPKSWSEDFSEFFQQERLILKYARVGVQHQWSFMHRILSLLAAYFESFLKILIFQRKNHPVSSQHKINVFYEKKIKN